MNDVMICEKCGKIRCIEDISTVRSFLCEINGVDYYEDTLDTCECGGDFVKTKRCDICDGYMSADSTDLICEKCATKYGNKEMALNFGEDESELVDINGFLAYLLSEKEINEVLQRYAFAKYSEDLLRVMAKDYCSEETVVSIIRESIEMEDKR